MESATSANTVDPGFFKPLVWAGAFAHTPFGLFYRVGHLFSEGAVLEKIEGASTLKSAWPSLDEAKAEAQRDYNARLLSAVSDASTQRPAIPAPVDHMAGGARDAGHGMVGPSLPATGATEPHGQNAKAA